MTTKQKRVRVEQIEKQLNVLAERQEDLTRNQKKMVKLIDKLFKRHPTAAKQRAIIQQTIDVYVEQVATQVQTVKDAALVLKETVNGEDLQAVYSQGKTSWITDQLLGYAKTHKVILEMKKQGDPSISIRKVKK